MNTPRRALALLLLAPAFALGACGGDSDADKITDIVKAVDKEPSALCDNATQKLLDQVGGDAAACEEQARAYGGDSAEDPIKGDIDVKVDGETATATFTTEKGNDTTAKFVKDGDDWKIDDAG